MWNELPFILSAISGFGKNLGSSSIGHPNRVAFLKKQVHIPPEPVGCWQV